MPLLKTKEKPKTTDITEVKKTVSQLTDIIAQLQHDVKKIKTRMGI